MSPTQKKTLGIAIASLAFGCLFFIPLLGAISGIIALVLGIVALVKISHNKDTLKGQGLAISGIVLGIVSIIIVPIIALLAAIAIPNLQRIRGAALNDAFAKASVNNIAAAIEYYAVANEGRYPMLESDLLYSEPPYLSQSFNGKTIHGYNYHLDLDGSSCGVVARPTTCNVTGTKILVFEDGELHEEECSSK